MSYKCPLCGNTEEFTREIIHELTERLLNVDKDYWETESFGDYCCSWIMCESCKFEGPPELFGDEDAKFAVKYDGKRYYAEGPFRIAGFETDNFYFLRDPSGKYMYDLLQVARATDLSVLTEYLVADDEYLRKLATKKYEELTGKSY